MKIVDVGLHRMKIFEAEKFASKDDRSWNEDKESSDKDLCERPATRR